MPEAEHTEPIQATGHEHRHRRKRSSHHHQPSWEKKRSSAKQIRTIILMALFVLIFLLVWYTLVSRPAS